MSRRRVVLCDNWHCPAWVSCAHALGRSAEHAAASSDSARLRRREVEPGKDSCEDYKRDKPRPWLIPYGDSAGAWAMYVVPPQ